MKQLMMKWKLQPIKQYILPKGFKLRTYREGDAKAWINVCADGLSTGDWSLEEFKKTMLELEGVKPEGIFFITDKNEKIVGTATGILQSEPNFSSLHMVCVLPEYRGLGLAKPINVAVIKYLLDKGTNKIILLTDDFRIPAIKGYLWLGFLPILYDEDMINRWTNIMEQTGITELSAYNEEGELNPSKILRV